MSAIIHYNLWKFITPLRKWTKGSMKKKEVMGEEEEKEEQDVAYPKWKKEKARNRKEARQFGEKRKYKGRREKRYEGNKFAWCSCIVGGKNAVFTGEKNQRQDPVSYSIRDEEEDEAGEAGKVGEAVEASEAAEAGEPSSNGA